MSPLLLLALVGTPQAHQRLPAHLSLDQLGPTTWHARLTLPLVGGEPVPIEVMLPCPATLSGAPGLGPGGLSQTWTLACEDPGGQLVGAEGLGAAGVELLVEVHPLRGEARSTVLHAASPEARVPQGELRSPAVWLGLGLLHVLEGADHLLFVAGLVVLCGWRAQALVHTITAFTLAHSLSLALAALGVVRLPRASVEAAIALSILYLALQLADPPPAPGARLAPWRRPAAVALVAGLIHGLGFAGALGELGLPVGSEAVALVAFNLGVEAGQLLFIAALGATLLVAGRISPARLPLRSITAWTLGIVGAAWTWRRAWELLVA